MKVKDVMTTNVAAVRSDEPLSLAAQLMWDCDCGALPVADRLSGRIVGMITDRDICMASWMRDRAPSSIRIAEAMSQRLHATAPEDSLSSAEHLMRLKQIRRLPVLDDGYQLVGIVSLADIATAAERQGMQAAAGELTPREVSTTLAEICHPRPSAFSSATY
jgi:CBS domain-containing protein